MIEEKTHALWLGLLVLVLFSNTSNGQDIKPADFVRCYYNSKGVICSEEESEYYELLPRPPSIIVNGTILGFFTNNDSLQSLTPIAKGVAHGTAMEYHPNGVASSQVTYKEGVPTGRSYLWYPNGEPMEVGEYIPHATKVKFLFDFYETDSATYKVHTQWDEQGNVRLHNGSGRYQGYNNYTEVKITGVYHHFKQVGNWKYYLHDSILIAREVYDTSGIMVKGMRFTESGDTIVYSNQYIRAQKPKKDYDFYRDIEIYFRHNSHDRLDIRYKDGPCFIQVMIDEEGIPAQFEFAQGNRFIYATAVKAIKQQGTWKPAYLYGAPIKSWLNLVIYPY